MLFLYRKHPRAFKKRAGRYIPTIKKSIGREEIMKKTTIITILTLILALSCCFFVACGEEERTGIKVVYELEGGIYKNSDSAIEARYGFEEGAKKTIKDLNDIDGNSNVERANYRLVGWYKTKTVDGESVTYSDKWDFEVDEVGDEGVILYAKWVKNTVYQYVVYSSDDSEPIGSYETQVGVPYKEKFVKKAILSVADNREGYTPTGDFYEDKELTMPFNDNFEFEESEEEVVSKPIYARYIKGDYKIIRTASELSALSYSSDGAYKGKSILIMNDIDFEGAEVDFASLFEIDESKFSGDLNDVKPEDIKNYVRFVGIEGYNDSITLSNFVISTNDNYTETDYDGKEIGTVRASLLGDLNGITVKNIAFKNAQLKVIAKRSGVMKKAVVAPLCGLAKNCSFNNVSVEITNYTIVVQLNEPEIVEAKTDGVWSITYRDEGGNEMKNCTVSMAERSEE